MNNASKAWLNVSHFDSLTTHLGTRRGKWERLTVTLQKSPGTIEELRSDESVADASPSIRKDCPDDMCDADHVPIHSMRPDLHLSKQDGSANTCSTNLKGFSNASSSSAPEWRKSETAEGNRFEMNRREINITVHGIEDLTKLDCLVFQNWYSSEFSLYQTIQTRHHGLREKLVYSSKRLVEHSGYEDDQQSFFAVYRSQFDTTDFMKGPQMQNFVTLKMKVRQESPVWPQCQARNIMAFRFVLDSNALKRNELKLFGCKPTTQLDKVPELFNGYASASDIRYRFSNQEVFTEFHEVSFDSQFIRV